MSRTELTSIEGESGFDPTTVPMYPILRAAISETDGTFVGLVDDRIVGSGPNIKSVRDAIIAAAAKTAGRRLGAIRAIRVTGQAPDGAVFKIVVTSTGKVYDTTDPAPTGAGSVAPRNSSGKGLRRKGQTYVTPDLEQSTRFRPHPVFVVVVVFLLVFPCLGIYLLFFAGGGSEPVAPVVPAARQLPVSAPEGYSPVARWAVSIGTATGTTGRVTADAERVYAATGSADEVTAYATGNGVEQWSSELGSPITVGPALSTVEGKAAVVVATSTKLLVLDPATGDTAGEWKFNPEVGSQVRVTTTGPVITGQSNIAQVLVEGALTSRVMPAGAQAVAPGPGGSLIAITHDRVYASTSSTLAGTGTGLDAATQETVTVAGWTGDRLVLGYAAAPRSSGATSSGVKLAAYTADLGGSWTRDWVTPVIAPASSSSPGSTGQLPLLTGPAGMWGVYGTTAVDLSNGKTVELEEWATVVVGDQIAFGTGAGQVLSAGPSGIGGHSETQPASVPLAAPQAVHGSSAYVVTAGAATTGWLYALAPAPSSSSTTPDGAR